MNAFSLASLMVGLLWQTVKTMPRRDDVCD
jgi:hypothetical protein